MPPADLLLELFLRLVLPAVVASGLIVGLALVFLPSRAWDLAVGIGLAVALWAGNWMRGVFPVLPDDLGWRWLQLGASAALVYSALLMTFLPKQRYVRWLLYLLPTLGLVFRIVPVELRTPSWMAGWGVLVLANAIVLEAVADREAGGQPSAEAGGIRDWVTPISWTFMFAGPALVLICAHSSRLSDAAVLIASALSGVMIVAIVRSIVLRRQPKTKEATPPFTLRSAALAVCLYLPGLMLSGYHDTYSSIGPAVFALCAAAPLALTPLLFPVVRRWPALQAVCEIALPLIPTFIAAALAIRAEGLPQG